MENFKIIGQKFEARMAAKSSGKDILSFMLKEEGNISPVEMKLNYIRPAIGQ